MKNTSITIQSLLTFALLAQTYTQASDDSNLTILKDSIVLPFAFSSDSTGVAGGIGAITQGLFQPQTTLATALFGGLKEEVVTNNQTEKENFSGGFIAFQNFLIPNTNRLFFSFIGLKSYFPKGTHYLDGSNSSSPDDALISSGNSNFFNTTLAYNLPLGEGSDNPQASYTLQDGFVTNREGFGGGIPFVTGRTSVGLKTFWAEDGYDNWQNSPVGFNQDTYAWATNGVRVFLTHDNTDFDLNPSRGYHFDLQYSKDFGYADSLQRWDSLMFKYNHYFNLDTFSFTKQNVLAFNITTAYSPSWDTKNELITGIAAHRPPLWEGARLGGLNRLRAYNQNRFSDKASFYCTAEYRAVLDWNPFKKNELFPVAVDWLQVVPFVEAGRVNDRYNFDLLSDMKYDVGMSLRAMVTQLPVRADVAYGKEGANFWVMIQHPFDY